MINIFNIKYYGELFFFLSDLYFLLNIFLLLIIGLIFTKYLYSLYNNVLLIDLSILSIFFLFFFNFFLYVLNFYLYLVFILIFFFIFFFLFIEILLLCSYVLAALKRYSNFLI